MAPWKAPKPRKGGSQNHTCDDRGRSGIENGRLVTRCSKCDKIVASDEIEDTD